MWSFTARTHKGSLQPYADSTRHDYRPIRRVAGSCKATSMQTANTLLLTLEQSFRLTLAINPVASWVRLLFADEKALTLLLAPTSVLAGSRPFGELFLVYLRNVGPTLLHPWTLLRCRKINAVTHLSAAATTRREAGSTFLHPGTLGRF